MDLQFIPFYSSILFIKIGYNKKISIILYLLYLLVYQIDQTSYFFSHPVFQKSKPNSQLKIQIEALIFWYFSECQKSFQKKEISQTIFGDYNRSPQKFSPNKKNLTVQSTTKIYLGLKDKKSFILYFENPIVTDELKQLILKKTQILDHELIVIHRGKQIHFTQNSTIIPFKDKSILHIINWKNVRNDLIEIILKFILNNQNKGCHGQIKLLAKFEEPIREFIYSKVPKVIQDMSGQKVGDESVNLVSNGCILNKNLNFQNYLIENGSQITFMLDNSEGLEKIVKSVSSHSIIELKRQKNLSDRRSQVSQKIFSKEINAIRSQCQVQKNRGLRLSQNQSEEFVTLDRFESKPQKLK